MNGENSDRKMRLMAADPERGLLQVTPVDLSAQSRFFSSRRRHTRYWRDWSSDVCSSDLPQDPGVVAGRHQAQRPGVEQRPQAQLRVAVVDGGRVGAGRGGGHGSLQGAVEIGSASWRERVQISAVAVSLKKRTDEQFRRLR